MANTYIKICKICGETFKTPNSRQQCCPGECQRINRRNHKREYNHRYHLRKKEEKKQPTNWREITKRCRELGKSYGQAVADGDI